MAKQGKMTTWFNAFKDGGHVWHEGRQWEIVDVAWDTDARNIIMKCCLKFGHKHIYVDVTAPKEK